jgi:hypothetical protein
MVNNVSSLWPQSGHGTSISITSFTFLLFVTFILMQITCSVTVNIELKFSIPCIVTFINIFYLYQLNAQCLFFISAACFSALCTIIGENSYAVYRYKTVKYGFCSGYIVNLLWKVQLCIFCSYNSCTVVKIIDVAWLYCLFKKTC